MEAGRLRCELCWFGATSFALSGFILVLAAIGVSAEAGWSWPGFGLLALAALALAAMALMIGIAFRLERPGRGETAA